MIRATLGTWFNYATTLLFQVLFAATYGSSQAAASFIIAFGIGVAGSGLIISSVQSAMLPRLLDSHGRLLTAAVRFVLSVTLITLVFALVPVAFAASLAEVLSQHTNLDASLNADLLRITGLFIFLQVIAGEVTALGLARGQRLVPSIGPAFPSLVAIAGIMMLPRLDIRLAYLLLTAGTALQILVLISTLRRPLVFIPGNLPRITAVTGSMFVSFALLAAIPPIERLVAAGISVPSAAHYDYAMRSLRVAQQLIVGGLVLAALGDWSGQASRISVQKLRQSLGAAALVAGTLLLLAASIAAVGGHSLVSIVFQHGQFTGRDTDAVTRILLFALPGFCAEGLVLILASAFLGMRKNFLLAAVGAVNFACRVALLMLLGSLLGTAGLAVAYSANSILMLGLLLFIAQRVALWPSEQVALLQRGALLGGVTVLTASALVLFASNWPAGLNSSIVLVVFAALFWWLRPIPQLRLLPR